MESQIGVYRDNDRPRNLAASREPNITLFEAFNRGDLGSDRPRTAAYAGQGGRLAEPIHAFWSSPRTWS
jgi:hypothetical protein